MNVFVYLFMESVQNDGKSFSLKDQLFNEEKVKYLASLIFDVYSDFNEYTFVEKVMDTLLDLELKERMSLITNVLYEFLPNDFDTAVDIMIKSLPTISEEGSNDQFIFGSYCEYAERFGCCEKNIKKSFYLFEKCAEFFSAEFAIRDFINTFPEQTYEFMEMMSKHRFFMCRRLASEGFRPKLPWAKKINYDYKKGAELLDNLFYDSARIVTRSVANHLNDISKFDEKFVLDCLLRWKKSGKQNDVNASTTYSNLDTDEPMVNGVQSGTKVSDVEMDYIINHSLRGLIKAGAKDTLEFLGYNCEPRVCVLNFNLKNSSIKLGEHIEFDFDILADCDEHLMVDYKITYPMPTGRLSTKVFKIKKFFMQCSKGKVNLGKRHRFVSMSTKKLYAGDYKLELIINGNSYLCREFTLSF